MTRTHKLTCALSLLALTAAATRAEAKPSKAEIQLAQKLNPLIGAINDASRSVFDNRQSYLRWATEAGPTCQEKNLSRPYPLQFAPAISKQVLLAAKAKPKMKELDAAATMYGQSLAALGNLFSEASTYYGERKYKDDACARGKTMHTELMAAWNGFAAGDRGIRNEIQRAEDDRDAKELPTLAKKFGKKMRWHHRALTLEARLILYALREHARTFEDHAIATAPPDKKPGKPAKAPVPADEVPETPPPPAPAVPDLTDVRARLTVYTALAAEAKLLAEGASRVDADISHFKQMTWPAEEFAKNVTALLERIDGTKPWSDGDKKRLAKGDSDIPGSLKRLINSYNGIVNASNGVSFSGKMK